jgi:hypothetical protein
MCTVLRRRCIPLSLDDARQVLKKVKNGPATRHGGALCERRYSSYSFLTSALEGGEWSASRPGRALSPAERALGTHCIGGWVGPRAGLDAETRRKIFCLCLESKPGRPVRSQTLYWLSYPSSARQVYWFKIPEYSFCFRSTLLPLTCEQKYSTDCCGLILRAVWWLAETSFSVFMNVRIRLVLSWEDSPAFYMGTIH